MRWHMLEESVAERSVAEFGSGRWPPSILIYRTVPPRYRSSYFAHIAGGGFTRRDTTPTCGRKC
ncbi:hypothetical protein KCP70_24080 [Salmonella enterica subsp. enterica]|nr:hypothetical protein KCP70_24080 [Salmonella enterica subsp. enterica]